MKSLHYAFEGEAPELAGKKLTSNTSSPTLPDALPVIEGTRTATGTGAESLSAALAAKR